MKFNSIEDPESLLIPSSSIILSVVPQAWLLHRQMGDFFKPNHISKDYIFSEIDNEARFLIAYIDYIIATHCCWMSTQAAQQRMNRYLSVGTIEEIIDHESFHSFTDDLVKSIQDFIGADNWNFYFLKAPTFNRVYIEKSVDYRIYEWTKQQYELLNKNTNSND